VDFTTLDVFVTVADTRSFSRAAERSFMTQSAVSKRIASLEADLGTPLFDRLGRKIQLTEAGETFLVSSRRLLADLRASREAVRTLGDEVAGRLKLATSHHVGIHRLPPVLKEFVRCYPAVELDLVFMDSELACAAVADGSLELAIVTLPDETSPRLETTTIWPDPLVIVAATDHPLSAPVTSPTSATSAKRRRPRLAASKLAAHPAVLPGRGTVTRRILLNALEPHGIAPRTSQIGEVLAVPLTPTQIKVNRDRLALGIAVDQVALVLHQLELDHLRVLPVSHLDHEFSCLKGCTLLLGVEDLVNLAFCLVCHCLVSVLF